MQNLRDKLLKAGLVSSEQAKQADARQKTEETNRARPAAPERPRRSEAHAPREAREAREVRPESRIPKLPPLPGSREHQRLISKQQLELDRKIRDLVAGAQVALEPGDQTFHFVTRKGRLRRLELAAAQREKLEKGELAVVERPDPGQIEHALVPTAAADQLMALSARAVRFFNKEGAAVGFLTDDELKQRQEAEAAMPPEAPDGAGDAERGDGEGGGEAGDAPPSDPSPGA
ncbi:MAG TPA: DUF2058 family protein [Myxococcaceae bacterium]|jgi:uncharacterized protein YaiL (DUF2058 family)